jgi:8-oxo-dGTP diphosphatase
MGDMDTLLPEILRAHKGLSFTGINTSFLCYDKDGEFVMAKRSQNARDEQGTWDQGAGGLKHGSSLEDNVRREVLEEYGATPQQIHYIGFDENFRVLEDDTPTHWISFHFAVLVDREEVRNNEPESFDDIGWFTLGSLPVPLHSLQKPFFEKYAQEIRAFVK